MTSELEIAPITPEDTLGVYAVIASAFGRKDEADLTVDLYREDAAVLALAARVDDAVIGACVFSRATIETEDGARSAALLAPLAVAPALQRCGVGTGLVAEGLSLLGLAGERIVLVLGDPAYYRRFGFSAKAAASVAAPWSGPAWQALALEGAAVPTGRGAFASAFERFG